MPLSSVCNFLPFDLRNSSSLHSFTIHRSPLGKTKGRARHKITWWWNKDTELAVKDKRKAYELWKKSGLEVDEVAYRLAKGRSKRVVAKAQDEERQRYCDMLEEEDGKGTVFRIAKQMVELNKDISASGCVKGVDGRTVVEEE